MKRDFPIYRSDIKGTTKYWERLWSEIGPDRFFRRSKIYLAMYGKPKSQRSHSLSSIKLEVRMLEYVEG